MKAAFFSVVALAMSAFAAPVADADNTIRDLNRVEKRAISGPEDLISNLQGALSSIKTQGGSISDILDQVQSGDMSGNDAADQSLPELKSILDTVTDLVKELTGAAGLDVTDSDVSTIQTLLIALVAEVTTIVKGLVTILGIRPQLNSVLHSVFQILAKVLVLVIGIVGGLVPGLVAGLSPLFVGLGNGLLAPLLTLVAGLLAGLAA
ncbi:hypothetical protein B0T10DRAFT_563116 [Thelonectria olida]|uniref:Uncharacterized protein n=1 Tax=Thelonectria olida TaxID=1576542 RepID=A0A9P8W0G6_9HYPO|nr:hypothetical protein B0T10DRAFT_563116 [Thelonectria olida]